MGNGLQDNAAKDTRTTPYNLSVSHIQSCGSCSCQHAAHRPAHVGMSWVRSSAEVVWGWLKQSLRGLIRHRAYSPPVIASSTGLCLRSWAPGEFDFLFFLNPWTILGICLWWFTNLWLLMFFINPCIPITHSYLLSSFSPENQPAVIRFILRKKKFCHTLEVCFTWVKPNMCTGKYTHDTVNAARRSVNVHAA